MKCCFCRPCYCWCCCCCCSCHCCNCWSHKPTFKVWLKSEQEQLRYWWYWVCVVGGAKSFSSQTQLLSWVEVELGLWQHNIIWLVSCTGNYTNLTLTWYMIRKTIWLVYHLYIITLLNCQKRFPWCIRQYGWSKCFWFNSFWVNIKSYGNGLD